MRRSGILLHITSLPSPYGIGTMGKEADRFLDFLQKAGQSDWQILPIHPTGYGDSPYQSFSCFAGNPYLIDLDLLKKEGYLTEEELVSLMKTAPLCHQEQVDFGWVFFHVLPLLKLAATRFEESEVYHTFCQENEEWLSDYALFMALKDDYGGCAWYKWEIPHKNRDPEALSAFAREHEEEIRCYKVLQFWFFSQWERLHRKAAEKGISIIGDIPIYVSYDSVEIWAHSEMFQLDENKVPLDVAGCPPDAFSADGQLWGNPLYDWDKMKEDGYAWWMKRIEFLFHIYDVLRLDHFRGFEAYYKIPYGDETAINGHWVTGPGKDFFLTLKEKLGDKDIIAEDLGYLTEGVYELLKETGYPGMKVLEFAFDSKSHEESVYLPRRYPAHCIAYTGTHDNEPLFAWFQSADSDDKAYAYRELDIEEVSDESVVWQALTTFWKSEANQTIVQMQDVLELSDEARMNTPATREGNWCFRVLPGSFTDELANRIYHKMEEAERTKKS